MKERLQAILDRLNDLEQNYQIRDPGMVTFREQKNELTDIIANIDTAPAAAPVAADSQLAGLVARITNIETLLVQVATQTAPTVAPVAPPVPVPAA